MARVISVQAMARLEAEAQRAEQQRQEELRLVEQERALERGRLRDVRCTRRAAAAAARRACAAAAAAVPPSPTPGGVSETGDRDN